MAINLIESLKDTPTTLAKKAESQGMAITPKTPGVVQSLGATPKQIDMAASPQAAQAEMKRQGQKAQRAAQVQSQAPRDVSTATDMRETAANLIDTLASYQSGVTAQSNLALGADVAKGKARTEQEFVDTAGSAIVATADQQAMFDSDSLREEAVQKAADVISGTETNPSVLDQALTVTIGELKDQEPEIYDYAINTLGLTEAATVEEVKAAVDLEINEITEIVDNQRAIFSDPLATPAERQQARQLMRDYGAAHLIATDKELDDFNDDMKRVGIIEFGGQTYTLEDLADNEAVAATLLSAATSLIDNPDQDAKDLGLENNPELFTFIQKHANAIESVLSQEEKNLKNVQTTVSNNLLITDAIPDSVKSLAGDINPFTTENIAGSSVALTIYDPNYDSTKLEAPPEEVRAVVEGMASLRPEYVTDLLSGDMKNFEANFARAKSRFDNYRALEAAKDEAALVAVGTNLDLEDLKTALKFAAENPQYYSKEQLAQLKMFDQDGDGKLDDYDTLQKALQDSALDGKGKIGFSTESKLDVLKKGVEEGYTPEEFNKIVFGQLNTNLLKNAPGLLEANLNNVNNVINKLDELTKNDPVLRETGYYPTIMSFLVKKRDELNAIKAEAAPTDTVTVDNSATRNRIQSDIDALLKYLSTANLGPVEEAQINSQINSLQDQLAATPLTSRTISNKQAEIEAQIADLEARRLKAPSEAEKLAIGWQIAQLRRQL